MSASAIDSPSANLVDLDETFLPIGQMRQIARVTRLAGETIEGEVDLGQTRWVFPQHLPDDPILPGTLMIEAAGQLVALWAWVAGQRGRPRLVRAIAGFHNPAGPASAHLRLQAEVRRKRHLYFATIQVRNAETHAATVEVVLVVCGLGGGTMTGPLAHMPAHRMMKAQKANLPTPPRGAWPRVAGGPQ